MSTIQTAGRAAGNVATGPRARLAALAERRWFVAAVYLVLTVIALYPVFSVTVPPLVDYPNHLARMHILATWDSDPALQKNYVLNWSLHPNMAMDLIVPLLAKAMPIYMAGKIFIAMTMLSLLGGTLALRKALVGRIDLWPVLTFVILYNSALFWGFLNYLFTAGLALCAFAGWIALRERATAMRVLVFVAATFGLYVGHIVGLFVYGLLVLGYEGWRWRSRRLSFAQALGDSLPTVMQFVVPAVLFLLWVQGGSSTIPAINAYGSLIAKFSALVSPANFGLPYFDIPTVAFLGIVVLLCRSAPSVRFAAEIRMPLLILAIAAVAMPNYLMGVWAADLRLPTIVACVAIAGTRFGDAGTGLRTALAFAAAILVAVRVTAISHAWLEIDRNFEDFRVKSAAFERGEKVLVVGDAQDIPAGKFPAYLNQYWHMAALAVIERSVFLPTLFSGHTSIDVAERLQPINSAVGSPMSRRSLTLDRDAATARFPLGHHLSRYVQVYWSGWPANFDAVLAIRFGNEANPDPAHLRVRLRSGFFDIYDVVEAGNDGAMPASSERQAGPVQR
jgi:hypothetical protein